MMKKENNRFTKNGDTLDIHYFFRARAINASARKINRPYEKGDTVYISFFLWWLLYSGIPMQAGRVFRLEGGQFRGDSWNRWPE